METEADITIRLDVLSKMEVDPGSCTLYEKLCSRVSHETDGTTDYGMATYRLLSTIHVPHCTNQAHRQQIADLWLENS